MMVRIITYLATDPDAPENMRAAAAMVPEGPGTHWVTCGPTEEAARAILEKHAPQPRKRKPTSETAAPATQGAREPIGDDVI